MDGVNRIQIPTPFDVGRVNCYAFDQDVPTLLDPGPATEGAYSALVDGLESTNFTVEDVERILITHPHIDHFGLASRIVRESGAETIAPKNATKRLGDPRHHFEREQAIFQPLLEEFGAPEHVAKSAVKLPEAYTGFYQPVDIDTELSDGDVVDVGIELKIIETPGHAPGSVCFNVPSENAVFTGDHVIGNITPNPLLTIEPGTETKRTRSLPTYLSSLRRLQSVDAEIGYPGHGKKITSIDDRISETIEHHRQRKERIAELIQKLRPVTAYDVMQEMFPDLPATEAFAGMSEVIGHLDLLENEQRVVATESNGYKHYRPQ